MSETQFDIEHVLKLEAVFNNPLAGLIILDRKGEIEAVNQAMAEELEQPRNQLTGTSIEGFLNEESQRMLHKYLEYCANRDENDEHGSIELQITRNKKNARHVELAISETYIRDVLFFVGVVKDITPEKKLQRKLQEQKAEKEKIEANLEKEQEISDLKNRFVSMASHEFRAPLAGLLSSVNLIERYINSGQNQWKNFPYHNHIEKHLKILKRALGNLQSILNEFLSLGKLEEGKLESHSQTFHLGEFFQMHQQQVNDIIAPPQELHYHCSHCNAKVHMDKNFLHNILNNLISNASKYSPHNSEINVKAYTKSNILYMFVEDQGKGIPEKEQKKIFDHFFRAKNVRNHQGTGLGLTITQKYVGLMNGVINFNSEENKGTTFNVELPFKQA